MINTTSVSPRWVPHCCWRCVCVFGAFLPLLCVCRCTCRVYGSCYPSATRLPHLLFPHCVGCRVSFNYCCVAFLAFLSPLCQRVYARTPIRRFVFTRCTYVPDLLDFVPVRSGFWCGTLLRVRARVWLLFQFCWTPDPMPNYYLVFHLHCPRRCRGSCIVLYNVFYPQYVCTFWCVYYPYGFPHLLMDTNSFTTTNDYTTWLPRLFAFITPFLQLTPDPRLIIYANTYSVLPSSDFRCLRVRLRTRCFSFPFPTDSVALRSQCCLVVFVTIPAFLFCVLFVAVGAYRFHAIACSLVALTLIRRYWSGYFVCGFCVGFPLPILARPPPAFLPLCVCVSYLLVTTY